MSDGDIVSDERLASFIKDMEGIGDRNSPLITQVEVKSIFYELQRLRAGRAAVNGFCWGCGATPRYQHKDGCKATKLRVLEVPNA